MTAAEILQTYSDSINRYATAYGLDPNEIASVIQTESSGNPNAYVAEPKLNDASYGLMQVLGVTARNLGYTDDLSGLFDPDTNINYGSKLWAQLKAQYGDDPAALYSAYNSGSPTAYETSSQVSSNVQRFLNNLGSLVSQAGQAIEQNPGSSGLVIALAIGTFLLLRK